MPVAMIGPGGFASRLSPAKHRLDVEQPEPRRLAGGTFAPVRVGDARPSIW